MNKKSIFAGGWCYSMPDMTPDPEGKIILISKASFGPLEIFTWGLDPDNEPFEEYQWLENDHYEDSNYFKHITMTELRKQIEDLIDIFKNSGSSEWVNIYEEILERLSTDHPQ